MAILVVEDDEVIGELLIATLARAGYVAELAQDGQEAMKRIAASHPTLILMDLDMPKVSGFEVLAWMRSRNATRSTPVIILTANSASGEIRQAIQLGAQNFLGKPFNESQLLRRIARALRTTLVSA